MLDVAEVGKEPQNNVEKTGDCQVGVQKMPHAISIHIK